MPVSALPVLARTLAVTLEELMGEPATKVQKRGSALKLARHKEKISQLPRTQQPFVMRMLDTVLAQQGR